jgi:predicted HicB family RNase H-like nuclease
MPRRKTMTLEISIKLRVTPMMYRELSVAAAAREWSVPHLIRAAIRDWFMRAH